MNYQEKIKYKASFIQCPDCKTYFSSVHYCLAKDQVIPRYNVEKKIRNDAREKYRRVWKDYSRRWKNGEIISANMI